jgi:dephospho-CoA kinase
MKRIFITGMSGVGKSSVIELLRERGYTAIDTDYDDWCKLSTWQGEREWLWREDRMHALLGAPRDVPLFVAGCYANQSSFYRYFELRVLLSAPLEVVLERVARRTNNPYGKSAADRAAICDHYAWVQPLLRKSADVEIDTTTMSATEVADALVKLALE